MPLVLTIKLDDPEPGMVTRAAQVLRSGGLVAFPTETVYGLGADATNEDAVRRVFEVKGRPLDDPLIVHVLEPSDLDEVAADVPETARRLAEAFWPGPMTVVVPRGDSIPTLVTGGLDTVAVRSPDHPVTRALLAAAAVPVVGPSANHFGYASPTTATHVLTDLGDGVDIVIDGGPSEIGIESTIVDCTVDPPRVLRPGGVTLEALREIVPEAELVERDADTPRAPGSFPSHYAPRAVVAMVRGDDRDVRAVLARAVSDLAARRVRVGVLAAREDLPWLGNLGTNVRIVALSKFDDPESAARDLFATLRDIDATNVDCIIARDFGAEGLRLAVRDRLMRAAAGRIVEIDEGKVDAAVDALLAIIALEITSRRGDSD